MAEKKYKLCRECDSPILRKGQRRKNPDEYRHAQGCPLDDYPTTGVIASELNRIIGGK